MDSYPSFRRHALSVTLLSYLLPAPIGLAISWTVISRTNLGLDLAVILGVGGALFSALIMALVAYQLLISKLNKLNASVTQAEVGQESPRRSLHHKGYFSYLLNRISALSDQLEQSSQHSQTELGVIKAEANRLRNVINSINDGVVALDKDMRIILFNKAAGKISGYNIEEAASKPVNHILPFLKGNTLVLSDWLSTVVNTDLRSAAWENLRLKTKEGKNRTLDAEVLYQGADPNGIRTLITFHDRTEAQELEDMKVDFVALAAHELRTPISIIRGYLEILEDELGSKLSPEQADFMRKLSVSASQLSGFINNILHVSRIEHGDLNLKLETADWSQLVTTAVTDLKVKADTQHKTISLDIQAGLPKVAVDKMSIIEVINNIVDNALKYSPVDSVVKVSVARNGDMIETVVKDSGVGIPENAIDKLFTKFYRSHRTRTSHRGTGLGLYMSKSIVEAHGGNVWVHSREGEGSTFGFMLPVYNKRSSPHLELNANNKITRGVHGWIKNHSLYRG